MLSFEIRHTVKIQVNIILQREGKETIRICFWTKHCTICKRLKLEKELKDRLHRLENINSIQDILFYSLYKNKHKSNIG